MAETDRGSERRGSSPSADWRSVAGVPVPTSRMAAQAHLDGLVADNRFTISIVFPAVGAVLLVASAEGWLLPPVAFNPWLVLAGVAVMRAPLVVGLGPLLDRRAAGWLALLVAYTYAIEFVGVHTGWPYGVFSYGVDLGPTAAGVPLGLPVFFVPIAANAYLLAVLLLDEWVRRTAVRIPVVVAAVLAMDLVLDPGAVALGFWSYAAGGPYYGVPASNFLGWILSATVAAVALDRVFANSALDKRVATCPFVLDDLVSFVLLWAGINAWFGNSVPVVLAGLLGISLLGLDRFDAGLLSP